MNLIELPFDILYDIVCLVIMDGDKIYDYDYLDDDIQLDNVAVSFGYHFYLNYKVSQ